MHITATITRAWQYTEEEDGRTNEGDPRTRYGVLDEYNRKRA
jgi:hypothetical protein